MTKKQTSCPETSDKEKKPFFKSIGFDLIRIILGILILTILLTVSLDMINDQFATKQDELIEEKESDWGWIVITVGYTVPLIFACVVPLVMCVGSKKDAQRKHLIKFLIVAISAVIVLCMICPKEIKDLVNQKEFCEMLEQKADEDEDFVYPEDQPSVKEVTLMLQRVAEWTAKAGVCLAVVAGYQGVRYKKLRDGEQDEEVPPEELTDDLPDVNWVER